MPWQPPLTPWLCSCEFCKDKHGAVAVGEFTAQQITLQSSNLAAIRSRAKPMMQRPVL